MQSRGAGDERRARNVGAATLLGVGALAAASALFFSGSQTASSSVAALPPGGRAAVLANVPPGGWVADSTSRSIVAPGTLGGQPTSLQQDGSVAVTVTPDGQGACSCSCSCGGESSPAPSSDVRPELQGSVPGKAAHASSSPALQLPTPLPSAAAPSVAAPSSSSAPPAAPSASPAPSTSSGEIVLLVHNHVPEPARLAAVLDTWGAPRLLQRHGAVLHTYTELTVGRPWANPFASTRDAFDGALASHPAASWYCKADDDTFVYVRALAAALRAASAAAVPPGAPLYVGYPLWLKQGALVAAGVLTESFTYGSGGAGYCLNHAATVLLVNGSPRCADDMADGAFNCEDVGVGMCLRAKSPSVSLTPIVGFHPYTEALMRSNYAGVPDNNLVFRKEPVEGYARPISYHKILPDDMRRMHAAWCALPDSRC